MSDGKTEDLHDVWTTVILILQISLTITALFGFGLYLWYLKSSDDQSQSRLLNILNGYLSLTCIGLSLTVFAMYGLQWFQTKHLTFITVEIGGAHIIAVSTIFLLISWATILNHFKPDLYLDISVSWSHKIAIPSLLGSFLLIDQVTHMSCDQTKKYIECRVDLVRRMVMIPCTVASFLSHFLVLTDDLFNLKDSYNRLAGYIRSLKAVYPVTNVDNIEEVVEMETQPPPPYNPSNGVNQHAEFISLNTGFMTLCLFNMLVLLISFITTVFEVKI